MSMRIRRALIAHRCLFNPVVWLAAGAVLTLVVSAPWSRGAGITTREGLVAAALPTPAHVVVVVEEPETERVRCFWLPRVRGMSGTARRMLRAIGARPCRA